MFIFLQNSYDDDRNDFADFIEPNSKWDGKQRLLLNPP